MGAFQDINKSRRRNALQASDIADTYANLSLQDLLQELNKVISYRKKAEESFAGSVADNSGLYSNLEKMEGEILHKISWFIEEEIAADYTKLDAAALLAKLKEIKVYKDYQGALGYIPETFGRFEDLQLKVETVLVVGMKRKADEIVACGKAKVCKAIDELYFVTEVSKQLKLEELRKELEEVQEKYKNLIDEHLQTKREQIRKLFEAKNYIGMLEVLAELSRAEEFNSGEPLGADQLMLLVGSVLDVMSIAELAEFQSVIDGYSNVAVTGEAGYLLVTCASAITGIMNERSQAKATNKAEGSLENPTLEPIEDQTKVVTPELIWFILKYSSEDTRVNSLAEFKSRLEGLREKSYEFSEQQQQYAKKLRENIRGMLSNISDAYDQYLLFLGDRQHHASSLSIEPPVTRREFVRVNEPIEFPEFHGGFVQVPIEHPELHRGFVWVNEPIEHPKLHRGFVPVDESAFAQGRNIGIGRGILKFLQQIPKFFSSLRAVFTTSSLAATVAPAPSQSQPKTDSKTTVKGTSRPRAASVTSFTFTPATVGGTKTLARRYTESAITVPVAASLKEQKSTLEKADQTAVQQGKHELKEAQQAFKRIFGVEFSSSLWSEKKLLLEEMIHIYSMRSPDELAVDMVGDIDDKSKSDSVKLLMVLKVLEWRDYLNGSFELSFSRGVDALCSQLTQNMSWERAQTVKYKFEQVKKQAKRVAEQIDDKLSHCFNIRFGFAIDRDSIVAQLMDNIKRSYEALKSFRPSYINFDEDSKAYQAFLAKYHTLNEVLSEWIDRDLATKVTMEDIENAFCEYQAAFDEIRDIAKRSGYDYDTILREVSIEQQNKDQEVASEFLGGLKELAQLSLQQATGDVPTKDTAMAVEKPSGSVVDSPAATTEQPSANSIGKALIGTAIGVGATVLAVAAAPALAPTIVLVAALTTATSVIGALVGNTRVVQSAEQLWQQQKDEMCAELKIIKEMLPVRDRVKKIDEFIQKNRAIIEKSGDAKNFLQNIGFMNFIRDKTKDWYWFTQGFIMRYNRFTTQQGKQGITPAQLVEMQRMESGMSMPESVNERPAQEESEETLMPTQKTYR